MAIVQVKTKAKEAVARQEGTEVQVYIRAYISGTSKLVIKNYGEESPEGKQLAGFAKQTWITTKARKYESGKYFFPDEAVAEIGKDLVTAKLLTPAEAKKLRPGRWNSFFVAK